MAYTENKILKIQKIQNSQDTKDTKFSLLWFVYTIVSNLSQIIWAPCSILWHFDLLRKFTHPSTPNSTISLLLSDDSVNRHLIKKKEGYKALLKSF